MKAGAIMTRINHFNPSDLPADRVAECYADNFRAGAVDLADAIATQNYAKQDAIWNDLRKIFEDFNEVAGYDWPYDLTRETLADRLWDPDALDLVDDDEFGPVDDDSGVDYCADYPRYYAPSNHGGDWGPDA